MNWGWDATESSAKTFIKRVENEQEEMVDVTYYQFRAASYRNYKQNSRDGVPSITIDP